MSDFIDQSGMSRERLANRTGVEIDMTDQLPVCQTLVAQFFELPEAKTKEMGIYLFGKRTTGKDTVKTVVEAAFPSSRMESDYFDLSSEEAANEVADMLSTQQQFGRELLGIIHTHPQQASTYKRQNFSPRGQSHNPDEDFYETVCKNSKGFLFGLAYQTQSGIEVKFLHSGKEFNTPEVVK